MSSRVLYPPIVNSYEPAFVPSEEGGSLRVYFSLSSLSSISSNISELTVHVNILRKDGVRVLKTENSGDRYRAAGIILNLKPIQDLTKGSNYYYITINSDDLKSEVALSSNSYRGWILGWIYKIQLRLSEVPYKPSDGPQAAWLQKNANYFSEWSSFCYIKAISEMALQIPSYKYDSTDTTHNEDTVYYVKDSKIEGSLYSLIPEANEDYNYITISLYKDDNLLEYSGELYKTELSSSYFSYVFKTLIEESKPYQIKISYETENGYIPKKPLTFYFEVQAGVPDLAPAYIVTVDKSPQYFIEECNVYSEYSVDVEEDKGAIGIKMRASEEHSGPYSGNLGIRRSSSLDNFTTWEDIKIITLRNQLINDYPVIYDYTIQSGVWYKYGIQSISTKGERGTLNIMQDPVQRRFNYSFLLGENNQQLRLQFNNTMNSFKHQIYDSKTDTLGGKYPHISRNAEVNYRIFPIDCLITRWMDEDNTFLINGAKDLYHYDNIVEKYKDYNDENNINPQYDYTFERDFRTKVLEFLHNGKYKLFKSPTEGNIIVRLMNISCTPNQTVDRLVYNFTAEANEIDDNIEENYVKYGFLVPGTYSTNLSDNITYLGQLDGTFKITDNIFELIYNKYDGKGKRIGDSIKKLESISRLKITINDPPMRVQNNSGNFVLGYNFNLTNNGSSKMITIYDPRGIYEFDSLMQFYYYGNKSMSNDSLYLLGDAEGKITEINATIDFLYEISTEPYRSREIQEKTPFYNIGQFYEEVKPDTSIYNIIYYKYYMKTEEKIRYLERISSIEIEANPYTVFSVTFLMNDNKQDERLFEVGETGILRLYELDNIVGLTYLGKRYFQQPYNESSTSSQILKNIYEGYYNSANGNFYKDPEFNIIYTPLFLDSLYVDINTHKIYKYVTGEGLIEVPLEDIMFDNTKRYILKTAADVSVTYRYIVIEGIYAE